MRAGLKYIDTVLNDPESGVPQPAGMIFEIVQGEGGVIPAADDWVRGVRAITAQADVPLIADEIQTGFGRTGRMFAFEHAAITPDVVVLSKAIGGSLPLSVVVYRSALDTWRPGAHAGTFRGNQLAMAAGTATIRYIRAEALHEHAATVGLDLMNKLRQLQSHHPQLGDVRGRGLMIGVEIVDPDGNRPDTALAAAIQVECLKRGLILELGGRHGSVVRFLPPLIITQQQLDHVCEIFAVGTAAALERQH
jgi:diaminobutyrate-2-oxoglutarate transaminase